MFEKPHLPEDGSHLENQPTQPFLPPELADSEATRIQQPDDRTRNMPPVKDTRMFSQPSQPTTAPPKSAARPTPEKPKRGHSGVMQAPPAYASPPRQKERNQSPLSLPIWSVLMMLFMVCGAVSCIVVAVLGLGGRTAAALPPQFVIITAAPTDTLAVTLPSLSEAPTLPLNLQNQSSDSALSLVGPTLAPVIISPTPETVGVGKTIMVDSQESGLNVRSAPGTFSTTVLFVADDGTLFSVVDGPAQADGFTWWKIQNPTNPNQSGWAASVFLKIFSPTPTPST